ncbi:MAG: DNA methyltransferase, partial [Solirubrobacteraceae bacterium]
KRPTDVWFHTIVPTNGREKTGYPTQKPEGVLRRMVAASSRAGGWCLDPFAGSGTLGAVCRELGRRFVLVDESPVAIEVMRARLDASSEPVNPSDRARAART